MRIAMLTDGLAPYVTGGIQRHSRCLAIALSEAGVAVELFHSIRDHRQSEAACGLYDFPSDAIHTITNRFEPYPGTHSFPGHYVYECWRLSQCFLEAFINSRVNVDFIYAQGLMGMAFVSKAAQQLDLPPIGINAHGYEMFQKSANVHEWAGKVMLRPFFKRQAAKADFVFSFGGKITEIVEKQVGVANEKIIELPNAVDLDWLKASDAVEGTESEPVKFLFVGRYERRKGIEELNTAIESFQSENAAFHFVGPIPKSKQLDLRGVVYHGQIFDIDELKSIFDSCDVLVCPSHSEGMPTVILEAMARGLAIVATDVGAVNTMVGSDNGSLLPNPEPRTIQAAIERLAVLPKDALVALKQSSLEKVKRFTWDIVAADTIDAVEQAIGPGRQ